MANNIPISHGTGVSSVAAEQIGTIKYQQIKVVGGETGSTSVWGIAPDGSGKVSVIGAITAVVTGSVATVFQGSVLTVPTSSTVAVLQSSSILAVPVGSTIAVLQSSSVIAVATGSVVAIPTGNQSVSGTVGASIIGWVPIQASDSSVMTIWQSPSVVGTYAEDAAATSGDKGIFMLGVRNDLQPSITSADLDYSPFAVGPTGAMTSHDAPITQWVQGTADLRVVLGASVTAIAAQGASVFTYIREVQVANMGSASVLVTFAGGLGSILGYTIAPAGGGSNYTTRLKTGANSAFTASISGTASVLVSVQGFTAKI